MAEAVRTRITAAEYAQMPETTQPMELIDGGIIQLPTPKHPHQRLAVHSIQFLSPLLPGGELCVAPSDVHLDELNVVQPDIFWVAGPKSRCKLGNDGYWHGAPDLVIEILSPSTALRDKRDKFELYERHGVREYWLMEPDAQYVEVWELSRGQFRQKGIFGRENTFESAVLGGKQIALSALFPIDQGVE